MQTKQFWLSCGIRLKVKAAALYAAYRSSNLLSRTSFTIGLGRPRKSLLKPFIARYKLKKRAWHIRIVVITLACHASNTSSILVCVANAKFTARFMVIRGHKNHMRDWRNGSRNSLKTNRRKAYQFESGISHQC